MAARTPQFGEATLTYDVGFVPRAVIGLVVWRDDNADGIRQMGEPRLPNIPVQLLDASGATLATVQTSAPNGEYEFNSLVHPLQVGQDYFVALEVPSTLQPTLANRGTDDSLDSDGTFSQATNDIRVPFTVEIVGYQVSVFFL